MSGRKRRGYKKVFEAVRQLLPDDINLKRAVTDFEGGLWRPTLEIFSINDDSTSPCSLDACSIGHKLCGVR